MSDSDTSLEIAADAVGENVQQVVQELTLDNGENEENKVYIQTIIQQELEEEIVHQNDAITGNLKIYANMMGFTCNHPACMPALMHSCIC